MKNYSDEIFVEQLRAIKFPDCSNYTSVDDACQDFVTKFLSVIGFVTPVRTLSVKSNTKPWFDIKWKQSSKDTDKRNFIEMYKLKRARFLLKK